jgi:hypothetical protein
VAVPPEHAPGIAASRWLVRGPGGGFALVGPQHLLFVRAGRFRQASPPSRPAGGEVGAIQAVVDDGRVFGIITAETDDSNGGPELWRSSDGIRWDDPVLLPLGGDVRSVAYGPYGFLAVGDRRGTRARALFVGFDNHPVLFVRGVNERPPLHVCVCSAGREAWGAGEGFVLSFERGGVHEEQVEEADLPVAMALDLVGTPWLLTQRHVLRRHVGSRTAKWRVYHSRAEGQPPFIAFGFTSSGVRVVDAQGGGVHLTPRDIDAWQARALPTTGL